MRTLMTALSWLEMGRLVYTTTLLWRLASKSRAELYTNVHKTLPLLMQPTRAVRQPANRILVAGAGRGAFLAAVGARAAIRGLHLITHHEPCALFLQLTRPIHLCSLSPTPHYAPLTPAAPDMSTRAHTAPTTVSPGRACHGRPNNPTPDTSQQHSSVLLR